MSRLAVIGIGNEWRHDDAAGLAVARALRGTLPDAVTILESEGEPVSLVDSWSRFEAAIVVDAMRSGREPGEVERIDAVASTLPAELGSSTHTVSLGETVELARALGRLPRTTIVYGIEGETFSAGSGLTPSVERAVEAVAEQVRGEVAALGGATVSEGEEA